MYVKNDTHYLLIMMDYIFRKNIKKGKNQMKYIINIEDEPLVRKSALYGEAAVYKVHGFRSLVFDRNGLDKLTPYDEEEVRKEYQKGLSDAWECARKIVCLESEGGMSVEDLTNIFGTDRVVATYSASEAMERIKAYEDEHKIRAGDEVIIASEKCVVLRVTKDGCLDRWMNLYGQTYANNTGYANNEIKKTGKHYDQIAEVLEKMRGEE